MKLKQGVKFGNPVMAICFALQIVNEVYKQYGVELTITSVNDSKHMTGSFHFQDRAFDCRTKNITTSKKIIIQEIKENLGSNFQVIFEGENTDNEHLHIEYDPK